MVTPKSLPNSIYSNSDVVFDRRRSKREIVQEMMFVNMCVRFCDNRIGNKKSVKFDVDLVLGHRRSKCKHHTRDDVCEQVCEVS